MSRFKCNQCFIVLSGEDAGEDDTCPLCGEPLIPMCEVGPARCEHGVVDGIAYCDVCGAPVCPICKCHNVEQVSRVTGYLAGVAGWNEGKRQELKDRVRSQVTADGSIHLNNPD